MPTSNQHDPDMLPLQACFFVEMRFYTDAAPPGLKTHPNTHNYQQSRLSVHPRQSDPRFRQKYKHVVSLG